jgi:hypothetical protein
LQHNVRSLATHKCVASPGLRNTDLDNIEEILFPFLPPASPLQVSLLAVGVVAQIMVGVTASLGRLYRSWHSVFVMPLTKAVRSCGERLPFTEVRPHPLILNWVPTKSYTYFKIMFVKF